MSGAWLCQCKVHPYETPDCPQCRALAPISMRPVSAVEEALVVPFHDPPRRDARSAKVGWVVAGRQAAEDDARAMMESRNAALAKLATAEGERDAARHALGKVSGFFDDTVRDLANAMNELATLRETLAGAVRAIDDEDIPTHDEPSQAFLNGIDHGVTFALDRAIAIIKGEAK